MLNPCFKISHLLFFSHPKLYLITHLMEGLTVVKKIIDCNMIPFAILRVNSPKAENYNLIYE